MAKERCRVFPNCRKIADKMDIPVNWLYTYIRGYNQFAIENNLEQIQSNKSYSDEELDSIQNKIESYLKSKREDESLRLMEFKNMSKKFGSSSAYAAYIMKQSGLTGEQISSLVNEIYRVFVFLCDNVSKRTKQKSFDEAIRKTGAKKIFDYVKEYIVSSADNLARNKELCDTNPEIRATVSDEEYQRMVEGLDIADKFITRKDYSDKIGSPDFFYEAVVLALPMINSVLGTKISEDFVFMDNDAKSSEEAENVYDLEEPTVEHWQDIIDMMCPETSISNIVKRVLMNTEKQQIKTVVKYYLNGVEIDPKNPPKDAHGRVVSSLEYITYTPKAPITGLAYTSNPARLARNLFKILENCPSESSMMDTLSKHSEFEQLYNILQADSRLRTTFFSNFNKYNMKMTKTSSTRMSDGTFLVKDVPLTGQTKADRLVGYIGKLRFRKASDNAIYSQDVIVNGDENNQELGKSNKVTINYLKFSQSKERFQKYVKELERTDENRKQIINNICYILDCLNLESDLSIANEIYDNFEEYRDFIANVDNFFEEGEKTFFNAAKNSKNITPILNTDTRIRKILDNILKIVNPVDVTQMSGSNMVTFAGNKMTTRIQPSAITNLIKKFKGYDYEQFMNWLNHTYLDSKQFCEDPMTEGSRIWNRWIADMVKESSSNLHSGGFKDIFGISRNLGFNETKFEKISDRDHMLSVVFGYLQNRVQLPEKTELAKEVDGHLYVYNKDTDKFEEVQPRALKGRRFLMLGDTVIRTYDNKNPDVNGNIPYTESKRKDVATIPMFITGDTNSLRQFKTIHYYEDEILDGIYGLYRSDVNTQKIIKEFNKRGFAVSANGKETFTKYANQFGLLTFLNSKKWRDKLNAITQNGLAEEESFKKLVKEYLDEEFEVFYKKTLVNLGVLDTVNGKYVYFDKYLSEENKELELKEKLRDFFYNYKFGMYNQTNLQHVTTLFFNGVSDHQKRNKGQGTTGTLLSAEAEINGEKLWPENNFADRVLYFKDVKNSISDEEAKIIYDFIEKKFTPLLGKTKAQKKAKELVKKYKSNSLTDGQGIRSFESYRRVLASAGENFWTREQEAAYQKIQKIITPAREEKRNLTAEEIQDIEDMMVVMQPIKPINDGIETFKIGSTVAKIGFQLKYAEVPIIPEMYPVGSRMRQIGDYMRENKIDLICSDKCLKKGSFGEVDIQYKAANGKYIDANNNIIPGLDENGNIVDNPTMAQQRRYCEKQKVDPRVNYGAETSFAEIMKNQSILDADKNELNYVVHNIPMDNYLIQNNIPDHSNGKVVVGTQQRKIIGSMIQDDQEYDIAGKKIKGDKLRRIYNALHTAKYIKSYKRFLNIIDNPTLLSKNLSFSIAQSDRGSLNILEKLTTDEDGNPIIPYSELGNGKEITNALVSIFKRFVIRQQVEGGNIVQASAMGIGEVLSDPDLGSIYDENGNEVAIEIEVPFNFEVEIDGVPVRLKFEKYCFEDGTFKPGINGGPTLIEEDYPGILDMEIHRIPTEGGYSMCRAHIKRCTPKTAANTMKRPAKLTSRFDDDFDIDKMFFSRRVYKFKTKKATQVDKNAFDTKIWKDIYDANPDIKMRLLYVSGRDNGDVKIKGLKRASRKQVEKLIKDYNMSENELHLNYFWDLAKINISREELYQKYAEEELARNPVNKSNTEYESEKQFDFESENSDILDYSVGAIDNAIFEIGQVVLSHESTMADRITPGGFAEMSNDARVIRCLKHVKEIDAWKDRAISTEEDFNEFVSYIKEHEDIDFKDEFDYSDPETLIQFKQWNQVAGEEIGIFANDNVNDAISKALSKFSISNPSNAILFGSLVNKDLEVTGKNDASKNDIGLNFLFDTINGRVLAKTLHELLGSSVDAVKDNALIDINLNQVNGDAGAMLVRLGYSTLDLGLLFNQPIVKDTLLYMSRSGEHNISNALKVVLASDKYGIRVKKNTLSTPYRKSSVTSTKLAQSIIDSNIDSSVQLDVARLLNKIMSIQMEVSRFVQDTRNTSANKTKTNFGDFFSSAFKTAMNFLDGFTLINIKSNDELGYPITQEATLQDWDSISLDESDEKLREFMDKYSNHPFQYENVVYNIIKAAMLRIARIATPYRSRAYEMYRRCANKFIAPRGVNGDVINSLHDFIPAISLVRKNGDFNPDARTNPLGIPNKEYYLNTFLKWFDAVKNPESEYFDEDVYNEVLTNPFLDIFEASYIGGKKNADIGAEILYLKISKEDDKYERWGYSLGWDALMQSSNPNVRRLGHDLYMYFYYVNGLNTKYNIAMEIAPPSVIESQLAERIGDRDIMYPDIFNEKNNTEDIPDDVIRKDILKFLIYNSNDDSLVKTMPFGFNEVKLDDDTVIIRKDLISNVKLGAARDDEGKPIKGRMLVRPIIKIDGALFILGTNNDFNRAINNEVSTNSGDLVYKRIQPNFNDETDFSDYFWARNSYIFGAFRSDIISNDKVIEDEEFEIEEEEEKTDAENAADEADNNAPVIALNEDGEEVQNCGNKKDK